MRFNSTGNDAAVQDPNTSDGSLFLWTDAGGVQGSPWPSFASGQAANPVQQNTSLPAVPIAP
jgi:hypothetical protein